MIKSILLYTLFFLCIPELIFASGSEGKIEGKVYDSKTKQPVAGALVEIMYSDIKTETDNEGSFSLSGIQSGIYGLRVSAPYYKTAYRTDILINAAQSAKIEIEMTISQYELDEVAVTGQKLFDKKEDFAVSINSLNQEEIRRAPGAAEDLFRMIQSLPGVTTASDSRNDLIVRGGSPFENLVLIDGIEIPNVNHFGTQGASGGPIGMINVDFLESVNFSAGGYPAKYGNKLSSITDVRYRSGDKNNYAGKFDLGVAGAGFVFEGPIQSGKSSFLLSARKSYLDLILSSTGLTAVPNYSNYNLKATYEINENHKLNFIFLSGIDDIVFNNFDNEDSPQIENQKYTGFQVVSGISHRWLFSDNIFIESSVSGSTYNKQISADSIGTRIFLNESVDRELGVKTDISVRISKKDNIDFGGSVHFINNKNKFFVKSGINSFGRYSPGVNYDGTATATRTELYASYTRNLTEDLKFTGGVRYDNLSLLNTKPVISPKLSASWQPLGNLTFNFAYGIYYQAPALTWLLTEQRNRDLNYIKADHLIAGIEYYPEEDIRISLEFFDKKYSDYAGSVNNPQISYANNGADYYTYGLELLQSNSSGSARGLDLFIQKKFTKNFYGMLNYSYSVIKFTPSDGIERNGSFDYGSVFTLIAGYKFSESLDMSIKYRYMGGRPQTPFDVQQSNMYNQGIFDYTQYNAERGKEYQRLDLRLDYKVDFGKTSIITFIDFQNLINTPNVEQLFWDQKKNKQAEILQWRFLPAGGIKVLF